MVPEDLPVAAKGPFEIRGEVERDRGLETTSLLRSEKLRDERDGEKAHGLSATTPTPSLIT
jgi:hypothetical protein